MKKSCLAVLVAVLAAVGLGAADGDYLALGPEPYPTGKVEFERYDFNPSAVRVGEVSTYQFSWNSIDAAQGQLEIRNDPNRPGYICAGGSGQIFGKVSLLYEAQDSLSSCMKLDTLKPDTYTVRIRESLDYYDMVVNFDHAAGTAHRVKVKKRDEQSEKNFSFTDAYCPVSVFLLIRALPWEPGDKRRFEVIDGNDRYILVVEAKEVKDIEVKAGTFKSIRLEPSIFEAPSDRTKESDHWWEKQKAKDEKRLSLIKSFEVWMGMDEPRPIVKARSDLYFGHVDMELVEMKLAN